MNAPKPDDTPLLKVRDLRTSFFTDRGVAAAVDGVSLRIPPSKVVALVGESGCGKSVTALTIMRLIRQPPGKILGGRIVFTDPADREPVDLLALSDKQMRQIRGRRIAMIFQEPMTALNPVFTIGEQIVEAIELHQPLRRKAARAAAVEMLRKVGIAAPDRRAHDYPHQLSGGMCQRVMIAMALACNPSLLIADEPTTALDVTVQRQILDLLRSLQAESGMSVLLITHDLGVVAQVADYVYVMYAGNIVEHAAVAALFSRPLHPYTQALLRCVPRLSDQRDRLEVIRGSVPDPRRYPSGCRFHPRCRLTADAARQPGRNAVWVDDQQSDRALETCIEPRPGSPSELPELVEVEPAHFVACPEAGGGSVYRGCEAYRRTMDTGGLVVE